MMPDTWYECVEANMALTQGDFVLDCPVLAWKSEPPVIGIKDDSEAISQLREVLKIDVIIMTQACDLEQQKVKEVVVCPIYTINEFKTAWEEQMLQLEQRPSDKAWRSQCEDIRNGFAWNYSMLNEGKVNDISTEHRVVDFHDIYTLHDLELEKITERSRRRGKLLADIFNHEDVNLPLELMNRIDAEVMGHNGRREGRE